MNTQLRDDVVQFLKLMLVGNGQEGMKFRHEIGLERYNPVLKYLESIDFLELLLFESGKYRFHLKNQLDKNYIQELIEKLEGQEIIL